MSLRAYALIGAGALFLALAGTVGVLKLQLDAASTRAELAETRQAAAEGSLKQYQAASAGLAAIDKRLGQLDQKLDAKKPAIIREILNAPPSDNAPIAPVLLRTLDRLRELCDEAGPDTCTQAGSADQPDEVRDRSAAPDGDAGGVSAVAGDGLARIP